MIRPLVSHPGHNQFAGGYLFISSIHAIDEIGKCMVCFSIDIKEKQPISFQKRVMHARQQSVE